MVKSLRRGTPSYESSRSNSVPQSLVQLLDSPDLKKISKALGSDCSLYVVGGVVRDAFDTELTSEAHETKPNLDLSGDLTPEESMRRLEARGIRAVPTGMKHGTITIVLGEDPIELTTFRSAANPTQYGGTIEEDLSARDFTINALAFSLQDGALVDTEGGLHDLEAGILRAVGDPTARFEEDPLRLMRMIRFGYASDRKVDSETEQAAKKLISSLSNVSVERIRDELVKILTSKNGGAGVRAIHQLGALEMVLPEMLPSVGFEQNRFHIHDVFEHTLWVIDRAPREKILRLAALFHDIGKPASLTVDDEGNRHFYRHEEIGEKICKTAMRRLRFSHAEIRAVTTLVRQHMRPLVCGPSGVRRTMRDLGEYLDDWLKLKTADSTPLAPEATFRAEYDGFHRLLDEERERTALPAYGKLAVNGDDLIELGMKSGKALGDVLKQLEEIVIEEPELNIRETLLAQAARLMKTE